jgi:hypothetical protein
MVAKFVDCPASEIKRKMKIEDEQSDELFRRRHEIESFGWQWV